MSIALPVPENRAMADGGSPLIPECPLCANNASFTPRPGPDRRIYHCCNACMLIFVEKRFLPERAEEERHYRLHKNGREHPGYVNFLNQAIEQALPWLTPGMRGLDYGCGPAPTLSMLLEERGIDCFNYDPIFFPEQPKGRVDFMFSTECFEHFFLT